jgi:hypothetical protein
MVKELGPLKKGNFINWKRRYPMVLVTLGFPINYLPKNPQRKDLQRVVGGEPSSIVKNEANKQANPEENKDLGYEQYENQGLTIPKGVKLEKYMEGYMVLDSSAREGGTTMLIENLPMYQILPAWNAILAHFAGTAKFNLREAMIDFWGNTLPGGGDLTTFIELIRTRAKEINDLDENDQVPDVKEKHMLFVLIHGVMKFNREVYQYQVNLLDNSPEISFNTAATKLLEAEQRANPRRREAAQSGYVMGRIPTSGSCRNWAKTGSCDYEEKHGRPCKFRHGDDMDEKHNGKSGKSHNTSSNNSHTQPRRNPPRNAPKPTCGYCKGLGKKDDHHANGCHRKREAQIAEEAVAQALAAKKTENKGMGEDRLQKLEASLSQLTSSMQRMGANNAAPRDSGIFSFEMSGAQHGSMASEGLFFDGDLLENDEVQK